MIHDFKFALRQLFKAPGFTTVAVLTLALAIGVNSAIFALINGVVLHPVVPLRPSEVVNVFTARQNASHDYRQFPTTSFASSARTVERCLPTLPRLSSPWLASGAITRC